jgi:rfaE bifunctional protein nucleotidyltransferase chain/domain
VRRPRPPEAKILEPAELLERFGRPRSETLVFTNGCFDVLHRGHATYLHAARSLGELLVVAVNSDRSTRALKGSGRPLVPEGDRLFMLASLEAVDAVTLFDEPTPRALIARLLPDLLVKGGDYALEEIAGREEVLAAGGEVRTIPLVDGVSTTGLVERIRRGGEEG